MGENNYDTNGSSWRKLVITKTNDNYVSALKTEIHNDGVEEEAQLCLSEDEEEANLPFRIVKVETSEAVDTSVSSSYSSNCDEATDGTYVQEDPLQEPTLKIRRRKSSVKKNLSHVNESQEDRAIRLAKMSAYAAQRLANETPEQRSARLRRMSEYASKRLAQETGEQRARRLARMSAYAAKRLASETLEQRTMRLAKMSAYAAKRQAMKKYIKAHQEKD